MKNVENREIDPGEQIPRKNTRKPYPGLGAVGILSLPAIGFFAGAGRTTPGMVLNNQTAPVKDQPFEGAHRIMDYQLAFAYTFSKGEAGRPIASIFQAASCPGDGRTKPAAGSASWPTGRFAQRLPHKRAILK